jgi:hypothetical protein
MRIPALVVAALLIPPSVVGAQDLISPDMQDAGPAERLRSCLDQPEFFTPDGERLYLTCSGETAERLFEAMKPVAEEEDAFGATGNILYRRFGDDRDEDGSQCVREQNAGSTDAEYRCGILIDLDAEAARTIARELAELTAAEADFEAGWEEQDQPAADEPFRLPDQEQPQRGSAQ